MTTLPGVTTGVPVRAEALSVPWLSSVFGAGTPGREVHGAVAEPIGHGMMADTFRVTLSGSEVPSSVVVKVAAADETSRRAARTYRSYELEVGFYRELAPKTSARVPRCHWAGWDARTGDCALVLEDLGAGLGGDQLRGCDVDQAAAAIHELAQLHADFWEGARRNPWLRRYGPDEPATFAKFARTVVPRFLERFGDRLSAEVVGVFERFPALAHRYDRKGRNGPQTVTHGDLRADNLIFVGSGAAILDWQNLYRGNGLVDLGYFLGTSMRSRDRCEHERDLVAGYAEGLRARGIPADGQECWDGYRRHAFAGICVVLRSFDAIRADAEREQRLLVMAERSGRQVLDLGAELILQK